MLEVGCLRATATSATLLAEQELAAYAEAIAAAGLPSDLSVKPTHLGLDLGMEVAEAGLRDVVTRAGAAGRLEIGLDRFVHQPSYGFPWNTDLR